MSHHASDRKGIWKPISLLTSNKLNALTNLVFYGLNNFKFTLAAVLSSKLVFASATYVSDELVLTFR